MHPANRKQDGVEASPMGETSEREERYRSKVGTAARAAVTKTKSRRTRIGADMIRTQLSRMRRRLRASPSDANVTNGTVRNQIGRLLPFQQPAPRSEQLLDTAGVRARPSHFERADLRESSVSYVAKPQVAHQSMESAAPDAGQPRGGRPGVTDLLASVIRDRRSKIISPLYRDARVGEKSSADVAGGEHAAEGLPQPALGGPKLSAAPVVDTPNQYEGVSPASL